jgi:N utilization substance protein B
MTSKINIAVKKTVARLIAVQAVYSNENCQNGNLSVIAQKIAENHLLQETISDLSEDEELIAPSNSFLIKLTEGILEYKERIIAILEPHLSQDTSLQALDSVLRSILICGVYEILYTSTPIKVAINEYVGVASSFFDKKEVGFINATLDKIAKLHSNDAIKL